MLCSSRVVKMFSLAAGGGLSAVKPTPPSPVYFPAGAVISFQQTVHLKLKSKYEGGRKAPGVQQKEFGRDSGAQLLIS